LREKKESFFTAVFLLPSSVKLKKAMLFSRFTKFLFGSKSSSSEEEELKMAKNTELALKEHRAFYRSCQKHSYAPLSSLKAFYKKSGLRFFPYKEERQGKRATMEDASFIQESKKHLCAGIFDGHAGSFVSSYAAKRFSELFSVKILSSCLSIYSLLQEGFSTVQKEIREQHPEWDYMGSTAVISIIDKRRNRIYTATLGDSSGHIYRILRKKWKTIPLSCVRNWASKRDFASVKKALGEEIPRRKDPKTMRHPPPGFSVHSGCGLNVSRALGDVAYKGVIHTPKITMAKLLPEDIVVLACDGLYDYASEDAIIEEIGSCQKKKDLAKNLIDCAIEKRGSMDNVSVISIFVTK
jgi:serine/threonine protein phosphatase PrpC